MTNLQEQSYSMYRVLSETCQRHAPTAQWKDHVAFAATFVQWLARTDTIRRLRLQQAQQTTGITLDKAAQRREMCEHTLVIADAVRAYAVSQKDEELAAKANLTCSQILYGKQGDAVVVCQNLHDVALAAPLAQPLIPYGVTTPKLAELQESIHNFADAIPKPQTTIKGRKGVTEQLVEEFEASDALLLEGLDRLLPQFKKTAPEFVKDYNNARVPVAKAATFKTKKAQAQAKAKTNAKTDETPKSEETPKSSAPPAPAEPPKILETPKATEGEQPKVA